MDADRVAQRALELHEKASMPLSEALARAGNCMLCHTELPACVGGSANLCDQIVDLGRPDLVRSTSFRNWLMGYPESWEGARATATRSSRKSPKHSSNQ